jgi:hypothetical protein
MALAKCAARTSLAIVTMPPPSLTSGPRHGFIGAWLLPQGTFSRLARAHRTGSVDGGRDDAHDRDRHSRADLGGAPSMTWAGSWPSGRFQTSRWASMRSRAGSGKSARSRTRTSDTRCGSPSRMPPSGSLSRSTRVAAELRLAVAKLDDLEQVRKPLSTSKRFVQQTMDEITGLIENSALDTRVAWGTRPPRPGHRGRPGGARRGNLEDGDRRRCVNRVRFSEQLAPAVGFEPTTKRLTAARSTTELRRSGDAIKVASGRLAAPAGRIAEAAAASSRGILPP